MKAKIGILSLGCPRNLVDSERMLGRLLKKGYKIVDIEKADIALVNTCSFIDEAKKESIDAILDLIELKKEGRLKKVIVVGCLPQRYKNELSSELKEIDAFVGSLSLEDSDNFRGFNLTPKHFAYLKIAEGCNHPCSFCVIPKIKGPLQSRKMEDVLKEVKFLDKNGICELNIIGQDITGYGLDIYKELKLTQLLDKIIPLSKNISWIRLLYLHPEYLTSGLLDLIRDEPKICKYIDLPIQHINKDILKAMNRKITKQKIIQILETIRKKIPQVAIRTSLIVGFPGEGDKEFRELLDFVEEQKFERLGVFRYSQEEGTFAFGYPNQVPQKVKEERFDIIMQKQAGISAQLNKNFLNKNLEVLIDEKEDAGCYLGRLSIDAPEVDGSVYVKTDKPLKIGKLVNVKIVDTYEYDLVGEPI